MRATKLPKKQAEKRAKALQTRHKPAVVLTLTKDAKGKNDFRAGWMFTHLASWWPYTTLIRGGKFWMVRAHAELMEETGMSLNQVKRALLDLESRGLIERERHWFQGSRVKIWITFPEALQTQIWPEYEPPAWLPDTIDGGSDVS